jgi:hypothetical protein
MRRLNCFISCRKSFRSFLQYQIGVNPGIHEFVLPTFPITGLLLNFEMALDPILIPLIITPFPPSSSNGVSKKKQKDPSFPGPTPFLFSFWMV